MLDVLRTSVFRYRSIHNFFSLNYSIQTVNTLLVQT